MVWKTATRPATRLSNRAGNNGWHISCQNTPANCQKDQKRNERFIRGFNCSIWPHWSPLALQNNQTETSKWYWLQIVWSTGNSIFIDNNCSSLSNLALDKAVRSHLSYLICILTMWCAYSWLNVHGKMLSSSNWNILFQILHSYQTHSLVNTVKICLTGLATQMTYSLLSRTDKI